MYLPTAPHRLVTSLEDKLTRLETEFHRAYWDSQVEATPENERRRAELELELRRAKGDAEALAQVRELLRDDLHDAVLRRQLQVLWLSLTANQMDEARRAQVVELSSAVESDFAAFRPEVDGRRVTDNDIDKILRTSDDQALRRSAWEASKQVGEVVAERVRELARIRNDSARDLGFADYYQMSLELQEIEEPWLFSVLDEVARLTADPFERWKKELDAALSDRFAIDTVYPWHYADPFFQVAPPDRQIDLDALLMDLDAVELARRTFAQWQIDLSEVIEGSDLYPREKKCQHAFCLDVDRSGHDVRILANIVPGERWIEVMLHESGHAAYDVSIDDGLPYLLRRAAHTFVTEAIALASGRLVHDPVWLSDIVGLPTAKVDALADRLARASSTQSLVFARWVLVMAHFERALYADPEADLDALWWELVTRFQAVSPPPGRTGPDWAAKIHVATAPVYYHNYLLGDLLASQLRARVEAEVGAFAGAPGAGEFLKQRIFRAGNLLRWDALIEEATGSPLSASAFAAEVAR